MITRFGENAADRGSGFGPWTVQASFRDDEGGIRDLGFWRAACRDGEGSYSRYAEPDAEGMTPVLKTKRILFQCQHIEVNNRPMRCDLQIFLNSVGCRWRVGRSAAGAGFFNAEAKTGGLVPLSGPLTLLLSAIMRLFLGVSCCG